MAEKLISSKFKTHSAAQFVESVTEASNSSYYVFTTSHHNDLGTPIDSYSNTSLSVYENMLNGKRVTSADVHHMASANLWVTGTAYDMYDDQEAMDGKNFIVYVKEGALYNVFKCLNNNKGANSTSKPLLSETGPDDDIYIKTSDGYQWKYMYQVSNAVFQKASTQNFIPIVANVAVSSNAVNGSIDTIVVNSGGSRYNAIANGIVTVSNVAGNTFIHELASKVSANIVHTAQTASGSNTSFINEKAIFVNSSNTDERITYLTVSGAGTNVTANVEGIITAVGSDNFINVTDLTGDINVASGVAVKGEVSGVVANVSAVTDELTTLSSNTDFYKGSAFYLISGNGAGQISEISEYIVTGSSRRVLLKDELTSGIDTSSRFEIGPLVTIRGDGQGASARAVVNNQTKRVESINILDRGNSYSHATVTVVGNTGIANNNLALANTANTRAIISPPGGHGSNVVSELNGYRVGVSVNFANTDTAFIGNNDFRQIGLIRDPLFANVEIRVDTVKLVGGASSGTGLSFQDGEGVTQNTSGATGVIVGRSSGKIFVSNTKGVFVSTNSTNSDTFRITGDTSGTFAQNVGSGVSGGSIKSNKNKTGSTFDEFDQRLYLTDWVFTTAAKPEVDSFVFQSGTGYSDFTISGNPFTDSSIGRVHSINTTSSGNTVALTQYRGSWEIYDSNAGGSPKETQGPNNSSSGYFSAKTDGDLVDNSGEVLYIENFTPVTRANNQSETVKLVIEF